MKFLRLLNYISLDVACGAMVCAAFFAQMFDVHLKGYGLASLGVTVWIIYTADHLLDARRIQREASTERHRFHQKNSKLMLVALVVAAAVDLFLIMFIRKPVLLWGVGLSVVVCCYIFFQRKLAQFKEIVIAILYSAGVAMPALSLTTSGFSAMRMVFLASFTLTALINLILFSWFEYELDRADGQVSIATFFGKRNTAKMMTFLFAVQAGVWIFMTIKSSLWQEVAVLLSMNLALLALFVLPEKFVKNDAYRVIGDLVFLFPLIYFFLR